MKNEPNAGPQRQSLPELATGNFEAPSKRRLAATVYEYCLLLLVGLSVFSESPLAINPADKLQPLTLLGLVIPPSVLLLPAICTILKVLTGAAIVMWIFKIGSRWIYIAAPILFIAFMSTVVESQYFVRHQTHFCAMAFVLLGAAKFVGTGRSDLKGSRSEDPFVDPLPGWCFMLLIYYIGISYTFSGISKLYYSGLSWGDGSSLMMWVEADAINRDNLVFQLLTSHHWLASTLQTTTLLAEVLAILVLFVPRLRPLFGLIFVGFHLSIELLFGLSFFSNIFLDTYILIVCFMVPQYRITGHRFFGELLSRGQTSLFSGAGEAEFQAIG